jgi:hypothetical protein
MATKKDVVRTVKNRVNNLIFILIIAVVGGVFLSGCVDFTMNSVWKDRDIVIDGNDAEWKDRMVLQENISVGACNDNEYLYLCLSATDKKTKAQLMGLFRQNFHVNFTTQKKYESVFGLGFANDSPMMDESLVNRIRFVRTPMFQLFADEMMKNWIGEILENDYPVALLSDSKGIDVAVKVSMNGRKLTYELKIPLQKNEDHPYAIHTVPGDDVTVSLSTSRIDLYYAQSTPQFPSEEKEVSQGQQQNSGAPHQGTDRKAAVPGNASSSGARQGPGPRAGAGAGPGGPRYQQQQGQSPDPAPLAMEWEPLHYVQLSGKIKLAKNK